MAGQTPTDEQFEDVDWDAVDAEQVGFERDETFKYGSLAAWVGLTVLLFYDYMLDSFGSTMLLGIRFGNVKVPPLVEMLTGPDLLMFGMVASRTDWLLLATGVVFVAYAVVPMYQNKRLTLQYWRQFRKNRAAVVSMVYLAIIFAIGTVGPMVMQQPTLNLTATYQPPMFMAADAALSGGCVGPTANGMCYGTIEHPFGTTSSGKDILKLVIFGMRVSMEVSLISTLMIIVISTTVGTTAAYFGGYVDEALMRYVDVQLSFPEFPLYLLLVYLFGGSLFLLVMIFGLFSWGGTARIVRSEALQRTEEEYIKAANSAGAGSFYIIRRHIVPNVSNNVITAATLTIPGLILAEASLSFIGLGDPNVFSWGQVIAAGRSELIGAEGLSDTGWWISTVPGLFLFFTILAFNFMGDALRDALDPRHSGGGN